MTISDVAKLCRILTFKNSGLEAQSLVRGSPS
jgi:hypothetical protein